MSAIPAIPVELLQRLNLNAIADKAGYGLRWQKLNRVNYKSPSAAPQFELVMESADSARRAHPAKSIPVRYAPPRRTRKKPRKSTAI